MEINGRGIYSDVSQIPVADPDTLAYRAELASYGVSVCSSFGMSRGEVLEVIKSPAFTRAVAGKRD